MNIVNDNLQNMNIVNDNLQNMNIVNYYLQLLDINGFDKPSGTDKATEHSYDEFYSNELFDGDRRRIDRPNILEIGSYTGGSIMLWTILLNPARLVSIDIQDNINGTLDAFIKHNEKCHFDFIIDDAYSLRNNTKELLLDIQDNHGGFDYIFEDGSHEFFHQMYVLRHYSDLLSRNIGAALYIEDIQSIENAERLANVYSSSEFLRTNFDLAIYDFRHIKGRYDDIIVKVSRKQ
jgi:hypothetical protein